MWTTPKSSVTWFNFYIIFFRSQDVTETSFITQPTTSQMSRYNPINDSANADTLTSSDLDIDTTGDSLKLCSRHVPGYSARRSTASQSAGSDDEEVEDTDVTNMESEFVTEAYVEVGKALSSPQVSKLCNRSRR